MLFSEWRSQIQAMEDASLFVRDEVSRLFSEGVPVVSGCLDVEGDQVLIFVVRFDEYGNWCSVWVARPGIALVELGCNEPAYWHD